MSTRATYKVDGLTYYIHHDGYPEYAHNYFRKMLKASNQETPNAFAFGDGNKEQAERTAGHNAHADTEYRYTLEGKNITVLKLIEYGTDNWDVICNCDIEAFLSIYN